MSLKSIRYWSVLICLLCITPSVNANEMALQLFSSINARLGQMNEVAQYKAVNRIAVENIEREKIVIEQAVLSALDMGIDSNRVEEFFKAQISVAKAIQYRYRADMLSQQKIVETKNLETEIRPLLLRLGEQIITEMAQYLEHHSTFEKIPFQLFDQAIDVDYVTLLDKQLIFNALQGVKLSSATQ